MNPLNDATAVRRGHPLSGAAYLTSPDGEVDSTRTESTDLTDASTRKDARRGFVAGARFDPISDPALTVEQSFPLPD
jgi:hypothetical protein